MNKGIMSGTRYFISYLLRNAPGLFLLEIVSNILLEFMRVLNNVLLYYWIIDIIIARKPAIEILLVLLGVSLFTLGQDIFNAWYAQRYRPVALEKLHRSIYCDIHKRICDMDMAHYDDVEFYNDVVLNMSTIDSSMENIMNEFAQIISCIVSIIISGGLFVAIDLKLAIFTIFSLVITFMLDKPIANIGHKKRVATIPTERKKEYIARIYSSIDYVKELRIYKVANMINMEYKRCVEEQLNLIDMYGKKRTWLSFVQIFLPQHFLLNFFLLAYLTISIIKYNAMSIADFVAAFNGVAVATSTLSYLLGTLFTNYQTSLNMIDRFKEFVMKTEKNDTEDRGIPKDIIQNNICFDKVCFSYPNSDYEVLKDISLTIPKGNLIAIVGYNGAGKSTLINLLLKMYHPKSGSIMVDGLNVNRISVESYKHLFSVLFQQFMLYETSVAKNVAMSINYDKERILKALARSGSFSAVMSSTDGIETFVGREFNDNGLLLSGGQQQMLACARLYYADRRIIVLDEPSSALDPIAERDFNEKIRELAGDHTIIVISHRLTTVKEADYIYMIEKGKIIEKGNHSDLLNIDGKYKKMWDTQAQKYIIKN